MTNPNPTKEESKESKLFGLFPSQLSWMSADIFKLSTKLKIPELRLMLNCGYIAGQLFVFIHFTYYESGIELKTQIKHLFILSSL